MTILKNQVLESLSKKPILYDIYYTGTLKMKPVVIFCHGYKGFKDWGAWHLVAQEFAKAGFCFLKFNFSHNGGTLENPIDFPDLDAFANNNYTIELDDLDRIITHLNTPEVALIGHSRGGGIVLIKAEEDPRVTKVVTWASVCDFKVRFQEETDAFKEFKRTGITYVENSRTKQQLPHHWQFYEDFMANQERLTIARAVKKMQAPLLVIHGDHDTTVALAEAKAIHGWNKDSKLEIISKGDHVFGATHPWQQQELPGQLQLVVEHSLRFLK